MGIFRIWKPETFQGRNRRKNYFEGWYFKLIDEQRTTVMAVIPGISIGESLEDAHAFIQVIDAVKGKAEYFRFAFSEFHADPDRLRLTIGRNTFSDRGIKLDLSSETSRISGELTFTDIDPYPRTFFSPGIMGPFSFVPGMECYHDVVNISHTINGSLHLNGTKTDLTGGEGYIEKDWGRSFPQAWVWVQANHFEEPGDCFMFSVARIPLLGRSFTGLIAFLRTKDGFYRFATYNGSKIRSIQLQENALDVTLTNAKYVLSFSTSRPSGGILKAPKNGLMSREIEESITAETTLQMNRRGGGVLFEGKSQRTGIEIAGSMEEIMRL